MTPCKRSVTLRGVRRSVDAGVVIVTDILLVMVMVMVMVMVVLVLVAMVMIPLLMMLIASALKYKFFPMYP